MKGVKVEKLSKESIHYWMEHPVTQRMLLMLENSRDLYERELAGLVRNNSLATLDLHRVSQLKGALDITEEMLRIKTQLFDLLEEETQNEVSNPRPESPIKGS